MPKYRLSLFIFLGLMAVCLVAVMTGHLKPAVPAWLAVIFVCFLAYAAFDIRLNFYLPSVNRFPTTSHEIALTIDDSPSDLLTERLLEVLKRHDIKASFFCIGSNVEAHPEAFKDIVSHGHFVGNHSYAHRNLMPFWKRNNLMADYLKASDLIGQESQRRVFRPPFGITNPNIAFAVKKLKMISIGWNVRSLDTKINHAGRISARILRKVKPGTILLFHDNRAVTPHVLDQLIPELKKRNYTFITVNEILERLPA